MQGRSRELKEWGASINSIVDFMRYRQSVDVQEMNNDGPCKYSPYSQGLRLSRDFSLESRRYCEAYRSMS